MVNSSVLQFVPLSTSQESVYVAPVVEECFKFGVLLAALKWAVRRGVKFRDTTIRQMGLGTGAVFMVDERISKGSLANLSLILTVL